MDFAEIELLNIVGPILYKIILGELNKFELKESIDNIKSSVNGMNKFISSK